MIFVYHLPKFMHWLIVPDVLPLPGQSELQQNLVQYLHKCTFNRYLNLLLIVKLLNFKTSLDGAVPSSVQLMLVFLFLNRLQIYIIFILNSSSFLTSLVPDGKFSTNQVEPTLALL